jgi:hypothetical protein
MLYFCKSKFINAFYLAFAPKNANKVKSPYYRGFFMNSHFGYNRLIIS